MKSLCFHWGKSVHSTLTYLFHSSQPLFQSLCTILSTPLRLSLSLTWTTVTIFKENSVSIISFSFQSMCSYSHLSSLAMRFHRILLFKDESKLPGLYKDPSESGLHYWLLGDFWSLYYPTIPCPAFPCIVPPNQNVSSLISASTALSKHLSLCSDSIAFILPLQNSCHHSHLWNPSVTLLRPLLIYSIIPSIHGMYPKLDHNFLKMGTTFSLSLYLSYYLACSGWAVGTLSLNGWFMRSNFHGEEKQWEKRSSIDQTVAVILNLEVKFQAKDW